MYPISTGLVIPEIIVHDTSMCQSRKFPTLCLFMPFQGQSKTILLALPIIPGEWWSYWPGISNQGQPTPGTFLRHFKEPSCGLSVQIEGQCWSEARPGQSVWSSLTRVLCSPLIEPREDCGCLRILGLNHGLLGWSSWTPLRLEKHKNHGQGTKWRWLSPCKCTV